MKKRTIGRNFVLTACTAGFCVFSAMAAAQEDVALPLDEAGAEAVALSDAGVAEEDAVRLRAGREREDGEDVIEVEFSCGDNRYEYVLRESDGMILEWSIEGRAVKEAVAELTLTGRGEAPADGARAEGAAAEDTADGSAADGSAAAEDTGNGSAADGSAAAEDTADGSAADGSAAAEDTGNGSAADAGTAVRITADGTELIGYEEAVRIALEDSGIADAELGKLKFEYDGRFYDYELELREGRAEYEYKIDAQSGEIVEAERD